MQELASSGIFEGSSGKMALTCSLPLLSARRYHLAGQLIQWSVQQGGPGLPVMSAQQYQLIIGDEVQSIDDVAIPDAALTAALQLVS